MDKEKIKVDEIQTDQAEKNFLEFLNKSKTYFLNGAWGSGKTRFIDNVKKRSNKKFIYLDLWNVKDERTVVNLAFNKLMNLNPVVTKILMVLSVAIAILMTDSINLGLQSFLINSNISLKIIVNVSGGILFYWLFSIVLKKLASLILTIVCLIALFLLAQQFNLNIDYVSIQILMLLFGIVALAVAIVRFIELKSDEVYTHLLECNLISRNKVLIIDDFDRVSEKKQEEAYKLFNILKGKLPIVFLGDYNEIAKNEKNEGNYLQKIIDRRIDLPYVLQPINIWNDYFEDLEQAFDFEMEPKLKAIFTEENRNLREREHFNDYVNLEFNERHKLGCVQPNQQLLIIYLYLFKNALYQKLLQCWLEKISKTYSNDQKEKYEFESPVEEMVYQVLSSNMIAHPISFCRANRHYFIQEVVSTLSTKEGDEIFRAGEKLKHALVNRGSIEDDFFPFAITKYDELLSSDSKSEIEKVDKLIFQLLNENKYSELMRRLVSMIKEKNSFFEKEREAGDVSDFFETNYFSSSNFDLSQKIFFYSYSFSNFLKLEEISHLFNKEIKSILEDDSKYKSQQRKANLLITQVVMGEYNNIIPPGEWSNKVKERVNELEGFDLIHFWELYRIIKVEYKNDCNKNISEIISVTMREYANEPNLHIDLKLVRKGGYINYRDLVGQLLFDFVKAKLEKLSVNRFDFQCNTFTDFS